LQFGEDSDLHLRSGCRIGLGRSRISGTDIVVGAGSVAIEQSKDGPALGLSGLTIDLPLTTDSPTGLSMAVPQAKITTKGFTGTIQS